MSIENISGNSWRTVSAPTGMTGNVANVSYTSSGSPNMNTWLYTNGLNLVGGTSYRLTYKYFNNGTFYVESMSVAYGTAASAATMTSPLADRPSIATTTVQNGGGIHAEYHRGVLHRFQVLFDRRPEPIVSG